jgi:hypothetical protein
MQRNVLIALVAVVVAAGVAATAAIVLDDGDETAALISPSPSATPAATSEVVTASPSPGSTPTATPAGSATAGPTASPTPAPTVTTKPGVTIRTAKSVDCDDEPKFCSAGEGVTLDDDRMVTGRSTPQTVKYTDVPTITMSSELRESNDSRAEESDPVTSIHVEVEVNNKTQRTFVFAKREIVLEIFRNGRLYDSFATKGPGFEMTPGSKMTGTFDRPVTDGGEYSWQAKVWYYEK